MSASAKRYDCCGIKEIEQIRNYERPEAVLVDVLQRQGWIDYYGRLTSNPLHAGLFVFSSAGKFKKGRLVCMAERLAAYIKEHDLGETVCVPSFQNPNTGRRIYPYLWYPHVRHLRRWLYAQVGRPRVGWFEELMLQWTLLRRCHGL